MSELKPGERKILSLLDRKGSLINKDIETGTGLSNRAVSDYLNSLQVKGFIEKEIETIKDNKGRISRRISRKYKLKPISYASLLFNDIIEFIRNYLKKTTSKDLKESGSAYEKTTLRRESLTFGWFMLTDNPKLQELYSKEFEDPKKQKLLLEFSNSLGSIWDSYKLSQYTKHAPKTRKIIETYQKYLLLSRKKVEKPQSEEQQKIFDEMARSSAYFQLKEKYPDVPDVLIPEEMINIDAKKFVESWNKDHDTIIMPYNLEELKRSIAIMEEEELRDLTEEELQELKEMSDFLNNSKNRKIYEKFLSAREKTRPKSLILCPTGGFNGYLDKLQTLFPKKFEEQIVKGMAQSLKNFWKKHKKHEKKSIKDLAQLEGLSVAKVKRQLEEIRRNRDKE